MHGDLGIVRKGDVIILISILVKQKKLPACCLP